MKALMALLALGALAACGSKEAKKPEGGASFGQVLPGSASDAMLPYDTASSAPPLEPPSFGSPDAVMAGDPSASGPTGGAVENDATVEPALPVPDAT